MAEEGKFKVGDRVKVGSKADKGLIKYAGSTQFAEGLWIGIELDDSEGKNDGSVKGVQYFECRENKGIFVREAMVTKDEDAPVVTSEKKPAAPKRTATKETAEGKAAAPKRTATVEKPAAAPASAAPAQAVAAASSEPKAAAKAVPKRTATKEKDGVMPTSPVAAKASDVASKASEESAAEPKAKAAVKRVATKEKEAVTSGDATAEKAPVKAAVPKRTASIIKEDPVAATAVAAAAAAPAEAAAKAPVKRAVTKDKDGNPVPVKAKAKAGEPTSPPARRLSADDSPPSPPAASAAPKRVTTKMGFSDDVESVAIPGREEACDTTDSHEAFKPSQRLGLFSQHGVVRFVGATTFAAGIWIGIEFDEPIGKCDGSIGGKRYFHCNKDHGIFLLAPAVKQQDVESSVHVPMRRMSVASSSGGRRSIADGGRRMSFAAAAGGGIRKRVLSTAASGLGDEIVVAGGDFGGIQILDDEGEPVDLEDLIKAFEDTREELEGIQELLEEAQEREMDLRKEIAALKSGAENTSPSEALRPRGSKLMNGGPAAAPVQAPAYTPAPSADFDNILMLTDSYKVTHHLQYPPGTELVYSYFESRGGEFAEVCFFGLQYFLKKYLVGQVVTQEKVTAAQLMFRDHFSSPVWPDQTNLFNSKGWQHILKEHQGRLPVSIKAVPEGTVVSAQNVLFTMENTDPKAYWLTNYLETLLVQVWYPTTVCTISREQKKTIMKYLKDTGCQDIVDKGLHKFKLHDFGFRGVSSVESAAIGGLGHLVNFMGTDTMAALLAAKEYYYCDCAGYSIPASEHSTITSWGKDREADAMRNMLEVYPKGLVACVSDSYDILSACENIWGGTLKEEIEKRDGVLVVRPDSGELPDTIIQVLEKLASKFTPSTTSTGHKLLPPCIRVIQGDGIDIKSLEVILKAMQEKGWAADNLAFGSGGGLLQKLNRDTQKIAFKCSSVTIRGEENAVYKDPVTDPGKKSKMGRLTLECNDGVWTTVTDGTGDPSKDKLVEIFRDGKMLVDDTFRSVRLRSEGQEVNPQSAGEVKAVGQRGVGGRAPGRAPPPRRTATYLKAKAADVKGLSEGLLDKVGKLKKVQVEIEKNHVSEQDVIVFEKFYDDNNGDLGKISTACNIPKELFDKNPPKNGEDFARMLLSGNYTGEKSEMAKAGLKKRLQDNLQDQQQKLKRTTTKESTGEATAEDIAAVAGIWTGCTGDIEVLSTKYGLSRSRLEASKPADARDFAIKLFRGEYTEDASATAMSNLRQSLQGQLRKTQSQLRRTTTKEKAMMATDPKDVEKFAALYRQHRGNLDQLARLCGCSISLLRKNKPSDDTDFATKLLQGVYTGDNSEIARAELRSRLREDLTVASSGLKRVTTKEGSELSPEQVDAVAKFYDQNHGDLSAIAKVLQIPCASLEGNPPSDGRDFARKLLAGHYTVIEGEEAKRRLRAELVGNVLRTKDTLKRVETKTGHTISDIELDFVGQIYTAKKGDYAELADFCGVSLARLQILAPADARTFAKQLLDGDYSTDKTAEAKQDLRNKLRQDLNMQMAKLKPAAVREVPKAPGNVELAKFSQVYTKYRGDPKKLAAQFAISIELLQKDPPTDGNDFARKLLDGAYTGETSAIAKAMLRDKLRDDLQRTATSLRRTATKEKTGTGSSSVLPEDVQAFAEVYKSAGGNLDKLAQMFHLELELVKSQAPDSAEDFAVKLLTGAFTGDKTELQKKFLMKRLRNDVNACKTGLKRTTTKERQMNDVDAKDVEMVAKVYDTCNGDLKLISRNMAINFKNLQEDPPTDRIDFAKKVLLGSYHRDMTEVQKKTLRDSLVNMAGSGDLKRTATNLRRTTTKEASGDATTEDIQAVAKMYQKAGGNLQKLAQMTGASMDMLNANPPTDATDFAKKLLEGVYTGDAPAIAVKKLRDALKEDLQASAGALRRTTTKERSIMAGPSKADIEAIRQVYLLHEGNLEPIADAIGLAPRILRANPPKNSEEFAINVLMGAYTIEVAEHVKAQLREVLGDEVNEKRGKLKRTTTKEGGGEPSSADIDGICEKLKEYSHDYARFAQDFGMSQDLLSKSKPVSDRDFATKLLEGTYSGEGSEEAKAKLRKCLEEDIQRKKSVLKRTNTKEGRGEASADDVHFFAKVYNDYKGNLDTLAKVCQCNRDLLSTKPPSDGEDFARKLLAGDYHGDAGEIAKASLRNNLKESINQAASGLKRTATKEGCTDIPPEDLRRAANLYTKNKGDLSTIAAILDVPTSVFIENPPRDAEEFAKYLFMGCYSVDKVASNIGRFREKLADDLNGTRNGLKRTTTKEASGHASLDEIDSVAQAYIQGGKAWVQELSKIGLDMELFEANPPVDARDFAKKMLMGVYMVDSSDKGKRQLRAGLEMHINAQKGTLKRTTTKEAKGEASAEDVQALAQVYKHYRGNLDDLAKHFSVDVSLMRAKEPVSAEDFAVKLLEGHYTGDTDATARAALRNRLKGDLNRTKTSLKRTATKEGTGPSEEDLQGVMAIYKAYGGDLEELGKLLKAGTLLEEYPPDDARDFAYKVLRGTYSLDVEAAARSYWRDNLSDGIKERMEKLKRTNTKQATGEASDEEIAGIVKVYDKHEGDLAKLAELCGVKLTVMKLYRPADGRDFAKKLLSGAYTADTTEVAKAQLRQRLGNELASSKSQLKRTTTKEATGEASPEDIQAVAKLWEMHGGNADALAQACKVGADLILARNPQNGEEFAKQLLAGLYSADASETAKSALRYRLREDLQGQLGGLKRTFTREKGGLEEGDEDTRALMRMYDKHKGNFKDIHKELNDKCRGNAFLDLEKMEADKPRTGREFAKAMLDGRYTVEAAAKQQHQFRRRLLSGVQQVKNDLKRTTTKEATGVASAEDIEAAGKVYEKLNGNLPSIAQALFIPLSALQGKNKPKDKVDFAKHLLAGDYSVDMSAAARVEMRKNLEEQLGTSLKTLKRTTTKEASGLQVSSEDVLKLAEVFDKHSGNYNTLAKHFDISLELVKKHAPKGGRDFAVKLLEGAYCADSSETAKQMLREKLREDLNIGRNALKRTNTKEASGPSDEDLVAASTIYTQHKGDYDKIARTCGISKEMLQKNPPLDATDFAKKLLSGAYSLDMTPEQAEAWKKALAEQKGSGHGKPTSKLTSTPQLFLEATPEQIEHIERLYNKHHGDLDALAKVCGLTVELLHADPPTDGRSFAKKLLGGSYCPDALGLDKSVQIQRQMSSLQRVRTKVSTGAAENGDIEILAKLYTKHNGDLRAIAEAVQVPLDLLERSPPTDAKDFAKKLLEGSYIGDMSEMAKEKLRTNLQAQLDRQVSSLKRTTTKEAMGKASAEELKAVTEALKEFDIGTPKAQIDTMASKFGLSKQKMEMAACTESDANKFAALLLAGDFSEDMDAAAKANFRGQLKDKLEAVMQNKGKALKRVTTKEATGDATEEELKALSNLYDMCFGDYDKLAKACGVSTLMIEKYPPEDNRDFAKKLLSGTYTAEQSAVAREDLRNKLKSELGKQKGQLRRVQTKEAQGVATPEDVNAILQWYTYYQGDLEELAKATGGNLFFMRTNPPANAEDFARKLLMGMYTGETQDLARTQLRDKLRENLTAHATSLRRVETKTNTGPSAEEIEAIANWFNEHKSNFKVIAQKCSISIEKLTAHAPKTGEEFAHALLSGRYSVDAGAQAQKECRDQLKEDVNTQKGQLKRVTTKEALAEPTAEEIAAVKKFFDDQKGDLDKISKLTGLPRECFEGAFKPKDGADFAKNMFAGNYSPDHSEFAKKELRKHLKEALNQEMAGLRRTKTKESTGAASASDIDFFAEIYQSYEGNVDKLSIKLGASVELMRKNPPKDKTDFAQKLLAGAYVAEELSEAAKTQLNDKFRGEISRTMTSLRRVATKEGGQNITRGDLDAVDALWTRNDGDYKKLAEVCGISFSRLSAAKPADSRAFAKGLLSGAYTEDQSDAAKANLRNRLKDELTRTSSQLKRTTTRESTGPSMEELKFMEELYNSKKGELVVLAKLLGIPHEVMVKQPPLDGMDFARNVLMGAYTVDLTEMAKTELRLKLGQELARSKTSLKRTTTKDLQGEVMQADIEQFAKIWDQNKGDLDKIAAKLGINIEMLVKGEPKDARDFARKLLEGRFTGETSDIARKVLRDRLKEDLQSRMAGLKRTHTKENTGPSKTDLDLAAEVWAKFGGDSMDHAAIVSISKCFCADAKLILKNPPKDKDDFARKVLAGVYTVEEMKKATVDKHGKALRKQRKALRKKIAKQEAKGAGKGQPKAPYRQTEPDEDSDGGDADSEDENEPLFEYQPLQEGIKSTMTNLRRTNTKENTGLNMDDVNALVTVYNKNNGDLNRLAEACGVPAELFKENPPKDARDWAVKLLEGAYTHDNLEKAKKDFRQKVDEELQAASGQLKRTNTKTGSGPSAQDIEAAAQLWKKCDGKTDKIAELLKINVAIINKSYPEDATDFAKKLLAGAYEADMDEVSRADFRKQLMDNSVLLQRTSTLRRTGTKESDGKATAEDIQMVVALWNQHDGNLTKLAEVLQVPVMVLEQNKPADAEVFARNLLEGKYTPEAGEVEKKQLRQNLNAVLRGGNVTGVALKRTTTKTYSGDARPEDIQMLAKAYDEKHGDLDALCTFFHLSMDMISANPPRDGEDFAKNVLNGRYSSEEMEVTRARLQGAHGDLKKAMGGLRRTNTKEGSGAPEQKDLQAMIKLYQQHSADLNKLAALCGASVELLRKRPPSNAEDFAANFLRGLYTA